MKLSLALGFILVINMLFFLMNTGVAEINPSGVDYFNETNNILNDFSADNENISSYIPTASSQVDTDSGNIFTDLFSTLGKWSGLTYLFKIVNALPNFLKAVGLPSAVVWAIGSFWHGMTIFLLVTFLAGGGRD